MKLSSLSKWSLRWNFNYYIVQDFLFCFFVTKSNHFDNKINRISNDIPYFFLILGLRNAFKNVFRGVALRGCYFHYAKCVWNRVLKAGLKGQYSDSKKKATAFSTFVRCAISMAFVPLKHLDDAYDILEKKANRLRGKKIKAFAASFLKYYKKTWLGSDKKPPLYARDTWNCFLHRGISDNNISEGVYILYLPIWKSQYVMGEHTGVEIWKQTDL